jgi:putative membrane protein
MENETSNQELLRIKAEETADPRVDLAVERTELALERTQLAWIRTTLSFLGSGIALDKGMEMIRRSRIESGKALFENAHIIGIGLSLTGTFLILFCTWFYVKRSHSLAKMKGAKPLRVPPALFGSLLVILLGIGISLLLIVS